MSPTLCCFHLFITSLTSLCVMPWQLARALPSSARWLYVLSSRATANIMLAVSTSLIRGTLSRVHRLETGDQVNPGFDWISSRRRALRLGISVFSTGPSAPFANCQRSGRFILVKSCIASWRANWICSGGGSGLGAAAVLAMMTRGMVAFRTRMQMAKATCISRQYIQLI